MTKKVKSDYYGIVHCMGFCDSCDETWADINPGVVRRSAKKHTLKTGHDTSVETGSVTRYTLETQG